jgi:hypothetical protein
MQHNGKILQLLPAAAIFTYNPPFDAFFYLHNSSGGHFEIMISLYIQMIYVFGKV